jgi:DNA-binding CsgD family transcriptional regulator
MVGVLAWEPAVIVVEVLRDEEWSITDKSNFAAYQQINMRFQELHKKHDRYRNTVNLANTIFNSSPRGMILLFETGELMATNYAADLILQKNDGISVKQNTIVLDDADTHSELIAALDSMKIMTKDEVAQTRWFWPLQLKNRPHPVQLALQIVPIHEWRLESSKQSRVGLLFLNDPTKLDKPSLRELQTYYSLTGAQAKVALALWGGMGIGEASDNLSITVNTARSHLREIYRKVGARSHAELMSVLTATMVRYTVTRESTDSDAASRPDHPNDLGA